MREILPSNQQCKCDLRTRLIGDGCHICNPELAKAYAEGQEAARQAFKDILRRQHKAARRRPSK